MNPNDLALCRAVGYGHRQRERAVGVTVLFFVGGHGVADGFAERLVGGRQQSGHAAVAAHNQALGNGHDDMAGFLGQRVGDVAAFNVGHQYVGGGEGIMFAVGILKTQGLIRG